jgi:hypothetical protein
LGEYAGRISFSSSFPLPFLLFPLLLPVYLIGKLYDSSVLSMIWVFLLQQLFLHCVDGVILVGFVISAGVLDCVIPCDIVCI